MRHFNLLVSILIMSSLVSSLISVLNLFHNLYNIHTGHEIFLFKILREFILLVIVLVYSNNIFKGKINKSVALLLLMIASFVLLNACFFILEDKNIMVTLMGLNIFTFLPIMYLSYLYFSYYNFSIYNNILYYLKPFIYFQIILSLFEVIYAPPLLGSTMFGSRAFGTFASPMVYGVFLSTMLLLIYIIDFKNNKKLVYLIIFTILLTGSRTALLAVGIIGFYHIYKNLKSIKLKLLSLSLTPILLILFIVIINTNELSGRNIPDIPPRLAVWSDILFKNVHSSFDVLFGWGLGYGSNAVNTFFGYAHFKGQFISDSLYIYLFSSFGLVGISFYLFVIFITHKKIKNKKEDIFTYFILFISLPFIALSLFPSNVIIFYIWGYILRRRHLDEYKSYT